MKHFSQCVLAGLLLASLAIFWAARSRVSALGKENERLRAELVEAQQSIAANRTAQSREQNEELERLRTEAGEIHKLRNEVRQLRAGAAETERLRSENQQLRAADRPNQAPPKTPEAASTGAGSQDGYHAKESWHFAGYTSPEAALQSVVWAMREGDTKTLVASLAPEELTRMMKDEWGGKSEAEIGADAKRNTDKINSIRILESKTVSDDEVVLHIYATGGEDHVQKISMKRLGAEWKFAGPKKE
jgi:hypothetical protein